MAKKILLISPVPTHPQTAGNRTRISALLETLGQMGHEVHFLHIRQEGGDETAMQRAWGDFYHFAPYRAPDDLSGRLRRRLLGPISVDARYSLGLDAWYDPNVDSVLRDLHARHRFDTVIVTYVFLSRALECFDKSVLKIIDTHDAFANRHRHYLERGEQPRWYSTTPREEGRGFDRANLVIAITEKEQVAFASRTRTPIITVGHVTPVSGPDPEAITDGRILFVASDNAINVHGAKTFLDNVFPRVRERIPSAELVLAGSVCRAINDQPGVVKLGRVDDLDPIYKSAAVIVNPVSFNTGISIKNLEALGYSKPLITATVGTEGLERGAGTAYVVADTPDEFTNAVVDVLSDAVLARRLAEQAYEFTRSWNLQIVDRLERALSGRSM